MKLICFVILILTKALHAKQVSNNDGDSTLKYVFEIVRHGARAPFIDDQDRFRVV